MFVVIARAVLYKLHVKYISMVTRITTWTMKCVYIEFDNLNCYCTGRTLRGNKVLTSLQLQYCGIRPEGLSELCSALEVNTTLTELHLSHNRFDDHSLASLGKLLILTVAVMTVSEEFVNSWYNVSYARQLKMHYY